MISARELLLVVACAVAACQPPPSRTPVPTLTPVPIAPASVAPPPAPARVPLSEHVRGALDILLDSPFDKHHTFVLLNPDGEELADALRDLGHRVTIVDCHGPTSTDACDPDDVTKIYRDRGLDGAEIEYLVLPAAFDWRYVPKGIHYRAKMVGLWIADGSKEERATARRPLGDGRELRAYSPRLAVNLGEAERHDFDVDSPRGRRRPGSATSEIDMVIGAEPPDLQSVARYVWGMSGRDVVRVRGPHGVGPVGLYPYELRAGDVVVARVTAEDLARAVASIGPALDAAGDAIERGDQPRTIEHLLRARTILAATLGVFTEGATLVRQIDALTHAIREPIKDLRGASYLQAARNPLIGVQLSESAALRRLSSFADRFDEHFAKHFIARARANPRSQELHDWEWIAEHTYFSSTFRGKHRRAIPHPTTPYTDARLHIATRFVLEDRF